MYRRQTRLSFQCRVICETKDFQIQNMYLDTSFMRIFKIKETSKVLTLVCGRQCHQPLDFLQYLYKHLKSVWQKLHKVWEGYNYLKKQPMKKRMKLFQIIWVCWRMWVPLWYQMFGQKLKDCKKLWNVKETAADIDLYEEQSVKPQIWLNFKTDFDIFVIYHSKLFKSH